MGFRNRSRVRELHDGGPTQRKRAPADPGAYRNFLASRYAADEEIRKLTVSVVMTAFNPPRDRMLAALQSVLNSTHEALEVIVVDDGSDVPVADWLPQAEPDPRIAIIRQENAGLGMARNAGIDASTGEFIFFIDDDDRVRPDAIALLVAHAEAFDADLVVGTRYLVNEHGQVLNISLEYLAGRTFTVYHGHTDYPFTDQMAHGRIIRRRLLAASGIRFETGVYEDRLFMTRLYLAVEAHFANIPTYEWTQYTSRSTLSSAMVIPNLRDKVRSLEACWEIMPRGLRFRFMREVLAVDLVRFAQAWPSADQDYQRAFFEIVGKFLRDRRRYLVGLRAGRGLHRLARAIEESDWDAMRRLYPAGEQSAARTATDDYFCHTHYHVLFSLLLAAERKRPAQIFIRTDYQEFSPRFLGALRATPLVKKVVTYTNGNVVAELKERLDDDPTTADIWLPHVMRRQFASIYEAIRRDDRCFAFNDHVPCWYVIEQSFEKVTRVEDAFASMSRELALHHSRGVWPQVLARLGPLFPRQFYGSPKVTDIVVGAQPSDLPQELAQKLRVMDPLAAMFRHREMLEDFFARAYATASVRFNQSTVLLYTQPLALLGHCSRREQLEMYRNMISDHRAEDCVIKPHPADTVDYRSLGVAVMDRSLPSEALNLIAETTEIDLALSFSSSAVNTTRFARHRVRLFGDDLTDATEIRAAILSLIPGHGGLRFRIADATTTLRYSMRQAIGARIAHAATLDPWLILGWPKWKLRRLLDVGRRRLPI